METEVTPTESQEALSALVALSEKATAGPWATELATSRLRPAQCVALSCFEHSEFAHFAAIDDDGDPMQGADNAAFIAALVNWFRANHAEIHESVYLRHLLRAANARGDGAANIADLDFEPDDDHTVADMANVGYSLMQAIKRNHPDYSWNESPAEIVADLMNELADAVNKTIPDYPQCSGDSRSCPENEGRGCCGLTPGSEANT